MFWCFHNGRFIQKMRGKASSLPTVTLQQGTVCSLIEEEGIVKGVKYRVAGGTEMEVNAPLTVICDGCFSNLRRTLCTSKPEISSCFVGLILENCNLPHANHGHVVLADHHLFCSIQSAARRLCDYLEKFYTLRKPVASTINTLAGALYKVFCASPDIAMEEMRQACFDYLSLGGTFSTAEGVQQTFFPNTVPAYYKAPPAECMSTE
ncbi:hypothetical protein GOP47_0028047 [Adiantum capillus-veneris]|nr:hypothetical protein GOP47_0028047 [Adiantum capillus-veneris]